MSEYRRKQSSSSTAHAASQGAAPTIPLKSSTLEPSTLEPSAFPTYSNNVGFEDMMSSALRRANVYHSEGTIEAEYKKYVSSMASPHKTDILRFWEVSFPSTIRNEANPDIAAQQDRIPNIICNCNGLSTHSSVFYSL